MAAKAIVLKGGGKGGRWRQGIKGFERKLRQLRPNINVPDDSLATLRYLSLSVRVCVGVCVYCWGVRPAIRTFQPFFALAGKNCVKCELHSVSWWCSYVLTVLVPTQPYIVHSIWNAAHYVLETVSFYDTQVVPGDAERVVSSSPAKLFHFRSRSCARLAVIGFQNEIHLMANEALIYAIHVVKACGS